MPLTLYDIAEAAARIRRLTRHSYTDKAARKAIERGTLKSRKIGTYTVVTEEDIKEYVEHKARHRRRK